MIDNIVIVLLNSTIDEDKEMICDVSALDARQISFAFAFEEKYLLGSPSTSFTRADDASLW